MPGLPLKSKLYKDTAFLHALISFKQACSQSFEYDRSRKTKHGLAFMNSLMFLIN